MDRGTLRVFLGAAPGVGTTSAMLDDARRRRSTETVMLACACDRGRQDTIDALREFAGGSVPPETLDVEDALERRPDLVLVDDLPTVDGDRSARWQDIDRLLRAGIDVAATLHIEQIAAVADRLEHTSGRRTAGVVPIDVIAAIDEIEVVDITPETMLTRVRSVSATRDDTVGAPRLDHFDASGFTERRVLMLLWVAERSAATLDVPRAGDDLVVAAMTDGPGGDEVLQRAARLAARTRAPLVAVHVSQSHDDGVGRERRRRRVEAFGATYRELVGADVEATLVSFVRSAGAKQLVIGAEPVRSRILRRRSVVDRLLATARDVDVHVVATSGPATLTVRPRLLANVPRRRQLAASTLGALLLAALTGGLSHNRGDISVSTSLGLYLLTVVGITAIGGAVPGLAAAVAAPLLANWFLIPPYHTLRIGDGENVVELFVFVSVASIVSAYVSIAARRAAETEKARREAGTLAALNRFGSVELPDAVLGQMRETFHFDGVAVRTGRDHGSVTVAAVGDGPQDVSDADLVIDLGAGLVLLARGRPLTADDHRVLDAFVAHLARVFEQLRLRTAAAEADALARADELRTAILRAVSHDLRSPLASIKASVSSLLQSDVEWAPTVHDEFLASIESETDRLTSIVTNLLDLSRLEAGVLRPVLVPASLEEIVAAALHGLGVNIGEVQVELPPDLADVRTDPALLERAVANLVGNAVAWSPVGASVFVGAQRRGRNVELLVIDHGPGIPAPQRDVVLQPFHRLGDAGGSGGLGLGLAIADRFIAATNGLLELRDTPGGGLTAVVSLPASIGSY